MRNTEVNIVEKVNAKAKTELELVNNQYSYYDAEDKNYICEIKYRHSYYPTKMIENAKLLRCCKIAKEKGKQFLYIVEDPKGLFVFNCSKFIQDIADLNVEAFDCPANTEFGGQRNRKDKAVIMMPERYAVKL